MIRVEPLGETSCLVSLGDAIDPEISARVCAVARTARDTFGDGLIECVPAYASVMLEVDPLRLQLADVCERLPDLIAKADLDAAPASSTQRFDIPVCYDEALAPDLAAVAQLTGLDMSEVVARHSGCEYRVYAIGFMPGFCFLGPLADELRLPRRSTPRAEVPAGSVAIAEAQTAVYPAPTPGGWHLIGRTAVDMRALCQHESRPLRIGDRIRFLPVTRAAYLDAGGEA